MAAKLFAVRPSVSQDARGRGVARWWRAPVRAAMVCIASGALALTATWAADAPAANDPAHVATEAEVQTVEQWLGRLRGAQAIPRYIGTYVITSISGALSSAKIWHQAEKGADWERIDILSGRPRTIFRRDDRVVVLAPGEKIVRSVPRHARRSFPNLNVEGAAASVAKYYSISTQGQERVAGLEADVVTFEPRDDLRYAYRVWSEKKSGLMLKSQVIDRHGRILEQAAFSDLDLAPSAAALKRGLGADPAQENFAAGHSLRERAEAAQLGWSLDASTVGFEPLDFYKKGAAGATPMAHWIFSDGLTTISLFIAPYDAERDRHVGHSTFGATHVLRQRWPDAQGAWWVAAVGEVPERTLQRLIDNLHYTAP